MPVTFPANWRSPITAQPGWLQTNVDPLLLLPSRTDLSKVRLDMQQALQDAGVARSTPIEVTPDGVIWDGHHAVRVAAEKAVPITVKVVNVRVNPAASSILHLPVS
jgi:hypothetical protein